MPIQSMFATDEDSVRANGEALKDSLRSRAVLAVSVEKQLLNPKGGLPLLDVSLISSTTSIHHSPSPPVSLSSHLPLQTNLLLAIN